MSDSALLAECRELALLVAPELQNAELYVVDSIRFDGLAINEHSNEFHGFAMRLPSPQMVERLGEDWRGHGAVIGLNLQDIGTDYKPDFLRQCVFSVTLHEVAHLVPVREKDSIDRKRFEATDCELFRQVYDEKIREYAAETRQCRGLRIDPEHDDRFIRRCGHLAYRAAIAGWEFAHFPLLGPDVPGMQLPWWMMDLLPELDRMKDLSFSEIESTAPPEAFRASWESCVEHLRKIENESLSERPKHLHG